MPTKPKDPHAPRPVIAAPPAHGHEKDARLRELRAKSTARTPAESTELLDLLADRALR